MTPEYQTKLAGIIAAAADGGGKKQAAAKPATVLPVATMDQPGLGPKVDINKLLDAKAAQTNFTATKDPNILIGRNGVTITRQQYEENQKTNLPFNSFENYADWVGGWSRPNRPIPNISPYYRTYAGDNIKGADILQLYLKHDPKIDEILDRNQRPNGEVPQYGPQDADLIRQLIAKNNAGQ